MSELSRIPAILAADGARAAQGLGGEASAAAQGCFPVLLSLKETLPAMPGGHECS